jgi:simple sugar transport system substrate-binding protein
MRPTEYVPDAPSIQLIPYGSSVNFIQAFPFSSWPGHESQAAALYKNRKARKMKRFLAALSLLLSLSFPFADLVSAQGDQYRFVMVSHIGSNDPNMNWLTTSMKTFDEKYPGVKTEYLSTNEYSLQSFIAILNQAIATRPDGIAVPILNSEALQPVLDKAIDSGIPVVAFNIADNRAPDQRIRYPTYVGGDEYLTGVKLGEYVIEQANAGKIPKPTKMMCANHDATHQGLKLRCQGMTDAMKKIGVSVDELVIGADPARARSIMQSYLSTNKDVHYIFTLGTLSCPWAYSVAEEMGLKPKLADKGMTIVSVDDSPNSLEGIKEGKILASHSQGFWLQGYLPMEILYFNKKMGMHPLTDVITGPIVINASNVDQWIKFVKNIIGEEAYKKQITW